MPLASYIFDVSITPLARLRLIGDREFEDIVALWATSCLLAKYVNVCEIGGSRDSGRDIIGYTSESSKSPFDLYQCKKYSSPLTPSQYYVEFGKLCYYTFIGEYAIPRKYYIVASSGLGNDLRNLVDNPERINQSLVDNWDNHCGRRGQILAQGVPLDSNLRSYILNFDFKVVFDIAPETLVKEFEQTKWYKYYFGGGLRPRPNVPPPSADIPEVEACLPYVSQLLNVYSDKARVRFQSCKEIIDKKHVAHLQEQRHYWVFNYFIDNLLSYLRQPVCSQ